MTTIRDSAFIEVALRKGTIKEDHLGQARKTTEELERFGIGKFIGAVLLEKNLASQSVVREIVEESKTLFVRCPSCKTPNPLDQTDRQGNLKCESCHAPVAYATGRISEEDLGVALTPVGIRRRQGNTGGKAAGSRNPAKRDPGARDSAVRPISAEPRAPGAQQASKPSGGPRHPVQASSAAPVQPSRQPSRPFFSCEPACGEITRFKVTHLHGVSVTGKLYRITGERAFGAVKVIDPALCADNRRLQTWVEALQRAGELPRSATLKPITLFRDGFITYVARPFLEGAKSLRTLLGPEKGKGLSANGIVDLELSLFQSLSAFHANHLVHGNLKPENVILSRDGTHLTDPALLLLLEGLPAEERILWLWANSRYCAPEILQGREPTPAADVFSGGRILEELLAALKDGAGSSSEGNGPAEARKWLESMAAWMTSQDPVDRPPSAKEVLRELRDRGKKNGRNTGPVVKKSTGSRFSRRRSFLTRRMSLRVVGSAMLVLALFGLSYQAMSWQRARKALSADNHPDEVADRLLRAELDALERSTSDLAEGTKEEASSGATDRGRVEEEWSRLAALVRNTPWEATVEEGARSALASLPRRGERELAQALRLARGHMEKREWVPALEALLAVESDVDASKEGQEVRDKVLTGLFEEEHMLFIPRGPLVSPSGEALGGALSGPLLVDFHSPANGNQSAGLSFFQAREAAKKAGKRLPTALEWDRMDGLPRMARNGWEAFAAARMRESPSKLYEWVDETAEDDLARAGYGYCRGGAREQVPRTHPLRRKKSTGYADVGVRLVKDLR